MYPTFQIQPWDHNYNVKVFEHGRTFLDTHNKIQPDSNISGSKAIFLRRLQTPKSNSQQTTKRTKKQRNKETNKHLCLVLQPMNFKYLRSLFEKLFSSTHRHSFGGPGGVVRGLDSLTAPKSVRGNWLLWPPVASCGLPWSLLVSCNLQFHLA